MMPNGAGLPSWASTIGSLVAVTIFGATAGGIAGYEKAQGVTEAQRLWFEQRLSAVQDQVKEGRAEIRSNLQEEWDIFEGRVVKALDRKVDVGTEREMMQRISDQLADIRRRIDEIEARTYGRPGGAR